MYQVRKSSIDNFIYFYFEFKKWLFFPGNKNGNRRTAHVRSLGYSDIFILLKNDLWDVLEVTNQSHIV